MSSSVATADASGGMANSSEDNRYLYNTSNGLLISRDSLSAQNETDGSGSFMGDNSGNTFDLRYQYNENDSWNGPSFALSPILMGLNLTYPMV